MQIRNDVHSFSNTGYQNAHTHHITKCLHEQEHQREKSAAMGMKQEEKSVDSRQKTQQDALFEYADHAGTERKNRGVKRGLGLIKGMWDAMGDEKDGETSQNAALVKENLSHINMDVISSMIKQRFPHRIVNKWENIREKITVSIKSALKRFNRNQDAFSALSDPKGRFAGKRGTGNTSPEKVKDGLRAKKPEISTAAMQDTHLMDSYSKSGEYCRLNENLTYQKNRMTISEKQKNNSEGSALLEVSKGE